MGLFADITINGFKLIHFVNLDDKDREVVRKWRDNENIKRWMYSDHFISPEEHSKFIESLKGNRKNSYWLIKDPHNNNLGVIYLNRIDLSNKNAYLGIYTNPETAVPGSSHILIDCLKQLSFDIAKLHTIKLEVVESNKRAFNFYKKSGFSEEGKLKEFVYKDGRWCDVIVMGIVNKRKR